MPKCQRIFGLIKPLCCVANSVLISDNNDNDKNAALANFDFVFNYFFQANLENCFSD